MVDLAARNDGKLDRLVGEMTELMQRSLGATIMVDIRISPALPAVEIDPNQLETALLNLVVNARDALHGAGAIVIDASEETIAARQPDLDPGRYIRLSVTDTGEGMDADTLKRATEPLATRPALRTLLQDLKRQVEQVIDEVSEDELLEAGASEEAKEKAKALVADEAAPLAALLFLWGGLAAGIYPVALSMAGERFRGADLVAINAAIIISYGLGSLIGPVLGGVAMDLWNPQGLMAMLALVFVLFLAATVGPAIPARPPSR